MNNNIINDDTFKTILKIALSVFKDTLFYNLEGINQDGWIVASDSYMEQHSYPLHGNKK